MIDKRGYIVDLDGTMYRGDVPIADAVMWANEMKRRGNKLMFATNNSAHPPERVRDRLLRMGVDAAVDDIITSSQAATSYLVAHDIRGSVLVVGETGLFDALKKAGIDVTAENPVCVLQGIDRSFTYDTLARAVTAVRSGALYVVTNPDRCLPTPDGYAPGAGAIAASIRTAAGVEPVVIGKPSRFMIDEAIKRMGLSPGDTVVVGDNLDTDIAAGANAGVDTVLVLTGVSREDDLQQYTGKPPSAVVRSLLELL